MGVGFSLAVMRRFEILRSFSFFGVCVFLVSNKREREIFTHQKKRKKKKKKQIATLNIFFCLFVCFSRHKAQTLPRGPFLRVTKHPHKTERDHIRLEKKKKKKTKKKKTKKKKKKRRSRNTKRVRIMSGGGGGGGSYDEVDLEDMDWNESLEEFTYACPCGDIFRITLEELKDGEEIARCPSCSLVLTVIYDPDELPSIANVG